MGKYIDTARIDWRLIIPTNATTAEENMIYRARKLVESQPTADVSPVVHADWIENWEIGWSACSHCGKGYLWEDYKGVADWKYCPNCGAKIDRRRER